MKWLLTKGRLPFLGLLLLASVLLGYRAIEVEVEISNESMNARDARIVAARDRLRDDFGHDEDLLLTVTTAGDLLPLVDELSAAVAALSGVRTVRSVTNFQQVVSSRVGAELTPLVSPSFARDDAMSELSVALDRNPSLTGLLISRDRRTAALVIETDSEPNDDRHAGRLIDAVRALAAQTEQDTGAELRLTGVGVQKHDVSRFVGRDQALLIPAAIVVIAVILWLFFRSLIAVVLPLVVTALTLAWTIGAYASAGFALNTVTSLLPPVVMVLSIATTVHVYSAWLSPLIATTVPTDRVLEVVARMRFPCSFTSLTTAIGLASLVLSSTPAVQQFGAFSALGVLISFFLSFTLVPIVLTFFAAPAAVVDTGRLARVLEATVIVSTRRPLLVVVCAIVVLVPTLFLLPTIRSNTDLIRFLSPSAELRRDTLWMDANFGPVNALDVVVSRSDGAPLHSIADFVAIAGLTEAIAELPDAHRVLGPTDPIAQLHRAEAGLQHPELPAHQADLDYIFELVDMFDEQSALSRFLTGDAERARLSVGIGAIGTARAVALIDEIEHTAAEMLGGVYRYEVTGVFHQIAVGSQRIVRDQVITFATALVLVVVLIGLAFRSLTIMCVALVPNLLPLLVSAAVMAAMAIDLSTGTAMIASVAIGLAVDDTIHYLARFRRERRGGRASADAIRATTVGTGRVLTMTSIVLAMGFWVGVLGSFTPTIYFSLFSGLTMLGALACDLLVLPACLTLLGVRIDRWVARTA
jgi:predicted RND superfamily exporter protein